MSQLNHLLADNVGKCVLIAGGCQQLDDMHALFD